MSLDATDHATVMVDRLAQQFRRPRIEAYMEVLAAEVQAAEDMLQDLLLLRRLDTATGLQLTRIGAKVGQPRAGVTDDDLYRRYVRGRIATNRSRGTPNDVLKVARAVVDPEAALVLGAPGIAAISLEVLDPEGADPDMMDVLIAFLKRAVAAGIRVILESNPAGASAPGDLFHTAAASFTTGSVLAGSATLTVDTLAGYPPRGQVEVDGDGPDEEILRYDYLIPDGLGGGKLHFPKTTGNAHGVGTIVTLRNAPGRGFALTTFLDGPLVGGETSLTVPSGGALPMPMVGTVAIDAGTPDEERIVYTARDATTVTLGAAVVGAHPDTAAVTLVGGGITLLTADADVTVTDPGGTETITIPAGAYERDVLEFEILDRLPADWDFEVDALTAKAAIVYDLGSGDPFSVAWGSTELRDLLGFTADISGATTTVTATNVLDESGGNAGGVLIDARDSSDAEVAVFAGS